MMACYDKVTIICEVSTATWTVKMNISVIKGLATVIALAVFIDTSERALAMNHFGLPTSICSGKYYECDPETKKRWSLFQSSQGIDHSSEHYLSVGACSKNGQSNSETYVLLALFNQIDEIYFDAKISFHNDLSNYNNTPASELQAIFPNIRFRRNLMSLSDSHAYIDYSHGAPFRYWLRHNRFENKLMMVAYFGYQVTFLCEFDSL